MVKMATKQAIDILLADGSSDFLTNFASFLDAKDYTVSMARDQKNVLDTLKKTLPQLFLLDIALPNGDGIETLKLCRAQRLVPPETLIVIISERIDDFTQVLALEAGADDFIWKQTPFPTFIARVKALLRRRSLMVEHEHQKNSHAEVGNLVLNRESFTVLLDNQVIDLAKKEFDLLFLLASNPEKVFTRAEIIDKIWGEDTATESRTLDVHIRKIRDKIGEDYIKTYKSIGYRFLKHFIKKP
jgi:two-component system, OmpR family, alkaline phosphatase synthesis response regulator PhoP